ncbi:DUF4237 domain-containing protein [Streptomyces piniterrae]|uniref:DUF4237 domain-containing protein n=1 Tax=Streptomyces piniterrae TaxID=2571125 RepID=A0A4U0NVA3_9ACTN|nr:TNT domain-containing protein [Streptomyces piniterrae]TJZ58666.1 DUF4237 domain-containing protein [Streptomyces piniterrae]
MRVTTGTAMALCSSILGGTVLVGTAQAASTRYVPSVAQPTQCLAPLQGDWSLGPKDIPAKGTVGSLVKDYRRFGTYPTAKSFLDAWKKDDWTWSYPPNDGFSGSPTPVTLGAGTMLDRFGSTSGKFVSPVTSAKAVPYKERSIPPSNLQTYRNGDTYDVECNYHVYKVRTSVTGKQGGIAAAFGQPGGGTQIQLNQSVGQLLAANALEDVTPGRVRTPQRAVPKPAKPVTDRFSAHAALQRAGIPDEYYRIDSVHEPRLPATEYYRFRRVAGRWELSLNERGENRLIARYADESRAAQRLYRELVEQQRRG